MKRALAASLLLLAAARCSGGSARPAVDAAVIRDAPPAEASIQQGDPALCGCTIDAEGTLDLFWSCYCGQSFADCSAGLSVTSDCAARVRRDYPACGFTVITTITASGDQIPSVYDASGNLVGRVAHNDLSAYTCPTDPTTESDTERAGQFPPSTCASVVCDPCYSGPFPCAVLDAATGD